MLDVGIKCSKNFACFIWIGNFVWCACIVDTLMIITTNELLQGIWTRAQQISCSGILKKCTRTINTTTEMQFWYGNRETNSKLKRIKYFLFSSIQIHNNNWVSEFIFIFLSPYSIYCYLMQSKTGNIVVIFASVSRQNHPYFVLFAIFMSFQIIM